MKMFNDNVETKNPKEIANVLHDLFASVAGKDIGIQTNHTRNLKCNIHVAVHLKPTSSTEIYGRMFILKKKSFPGADSVKYNVVKSFNDLVSPVICKNNQL